MKPGHSPARIQPDFAQVAQDVTRALAEDLGSGDISAALLEDCPAIAAIIGREQAVVCGRAWAEACFTQLDQNAQLEWKLAEGEWAEPGQRWCTVRASTRALLSAERSALNFLQLLGGTATATAELVKLVKGTGVKLLDTRKTIPGLRLAQKYAVATGGGYNHRLGLYDEYLLKENHLAQSAGLAKAIAAARQANPHVPLVVEVENLEQLKQALGAGPDRILLDNFSVGMIVRAVAVTSGELPLEVSGGVGLKNLRSLALTGVDYISIGGLTKHVRAVDLSLRLE